MSNIHNYPLTATQINDEDFYDVDYWNGVAYETRKISGATLKSLLSGGAEELNDLTDVTTDLPLTPTNADDGRVLYFDIDSGQWISDDIANISNVVKDCKTSVGTGTIPKGTPVYFSGYDNDLLVVEPCDNTSLATMPCIGITAEVLDDTNAKKVVSFGKIQGVDTSAFLEGDELYVGTAGGFTTTRPIGTAEIQKVAIVLKSDVTGGQLKVFNTSRVAGLPNLPQDNAWVGDVNGYPVATPISNLPNIYNADGQIQSDRYITFANAGNGDAIAFFANGVIGTNSLIFGVQDGLPGQPELAKVFIGQSYLLNSLAFFVECKTSFINTIAISNNDALEPYHIILQDNQSGAPITRRLHLNTLPLITADRFQQFQDKDGTIALLSDIPSGSAEKFIHQSYAYDMSPAAGYTWNGATVGASAITTLNQSYRAQELVGTGQPDGCFMNAQLPGYYVANTDINVTIGFSVDGTGGDVKLFVGLQKTNGPNLGTDVDTEWQDVTFTAAAGPIAGKATFTMNGTGHGAGLPIAVKVYRDPSDAADTYTGIAYITNILIESV